MLSPRKLAPTGSCRNLESKGLTLEIDQFQPTVNAYNLEPTLSGPNLIQYGRTLVPEPDLSGQNLIQHGRTHLLAAEPMRCRPGLDCGEQGSHHNIDRFRPIRLGSTRYSIVAAVASIMSGSIMPSD